MRRLSSFQARVAPIAKRAAHGALVATVAALLEGTANNPPDVLESPPAPQTPDTTVWIAQISDPHLFEEPKKGKTWTDDEAQNQQAFAQALELLGLRTMTIGRLPDALVITGDLGVDPIFRAKRDTTKSPISRERQVAIVASLLKTSPVKNIFVVAGNNDIADERPDPSGLAYFHQFISSVDSVTRSQVRVYDLTGCYVNPRVPVRECYHDLREGVRLVGFASATFKNAPPSVSDKLLSYVSSRRAMVASVNYVDDSRIVQRLASLVAQASRADRKAVILTHEPDLDDPFTLDTLRAAEASLPDPIATYDPAVWNVDARVRESWVQAVSNPTVIAVLAGHFHSANRANYFRPYLFSATRSHPNLEPFFVRPPRRAGPERLFVSPPLAVKNQNNSSPQARGISLYRIDGRDIHREIMWYEAGRGFVAQQGDGGVGGESRVEATIQQALSAGLTGIDRMGIVLFAILAATGGILMGLAEGVRLKKQSGFGWPVYFSYLSPVGWCFVGLLVALTFFLPDASDRGEFALWYASTFGIWTFLMLIEVRVFRQTLRIRNNYSRPWWSPSK